MKLPPKPRYSDSQAAFTLIELLVVIAIIAALAVLIIPTLRMAMATSRNTKCISNLRMVAAAANLYRADKGYYPQGNYTPTTNGWQDQLAKAGFLDIATNKAKVINCPEFDKVPNPPATLFGSQKPSVVYSYWINPTQFRAEQNAVDNSMANSLSGKSCVLFMDGAGANQGMNLWGFSNGANAVFSSKDLVRMVFRHSGRLSASELSSWNSSKPYPGKMNLAFADGHVESATVPVGPSSSWPATSIFAQADRW